MIYEEMVDAGKLRIVCLADLTKRLGEQFPIIAQHPNYEVVLLGAEGLLQCHSLEILDLFHSLNRLTQYLNEMVGEIVDTKILTNIHHLSVSYRRKTAEWYHNEWDIDSGTITALLGAHISPALAVLMTEEELHTMLRNVGKQRMPKLLAGIAAFRERHPEAIRI